MFTAFSDHVLGPWHQILKEILHTIPEELKANDSCCQEHTEQNQDEVNEDNSLDIRQRILSEISKIKNTGTIILMMLPQILNYTQILSLPIA